MNKTRQNPDNSQDSSSSHEMMALFEIVKAVNSSLDLDVVLDIILEKTLDLFKAEAGSIMLVNRDGYLTIRAAMGLSQDIINKTLVRPGEGIAGWVFQSGNAVLLDGKVRDDKFTKVVDRKEDINTSIAVPLISKGTNIGVLMIRRSAPKTRYTEADKRLVNMIADQAALAIDNAAQFEREIERLAQLRQLNNELTLEKLKIETILRSMADGVIVTDYTGAVMMVNKAACRILGKTELDVLGRSFDGLFPGQCTFDDIKDALFVKKYRFTKEITKIENNNEFYFKLLATGMRSDDHRVEGAVVVMQNITELRRLDKMKTEFVSMVSHELRTPLTSIHGFTELIMLRDFSKERRDRYLKIILEDSKRLSRLIENLLDLSRMESGQITFHRQPVNIEGLIPEVVDSFEGQLTKHEVIYLTEGEIPVLMMDRDMFINVLTNLISNAIKYSPDGGEIRVLLRQDGDNIRLSVKDHGIGIAKDMQEKVFEKFFRVDSSLTRETGGTGLGLATVKYIVEGLGGKIWVESEMDRGSEFIVLLPVEDL